MIRLIPLPMALLVLTACPKGDDSDCERRTWHADADGDGFGDPDGHVERACDAPDGYVEDVTDCDDADPTAHPGGVEVCGGGDEDCDGTVDVGAADPTSWYVDADDDGYGDAATGLAACAAPAGYVADATDCDDADPTAHPGADEVCGGGDEDCDGVVDDDPVDAISGYADLDGDGYGDASAPASACSADGLSADPTDCDDADRAVHPGAPEICGGPDRDCDGTYDACPRWSGELLPTDLPSVAVSGAGGRWVGVGDLDGDGHPDFAAGRTQYTGSAYAYAFAGLAVGGAYTASDAFAAVTAGSTYSFGGVPGDVTGDGHDDLLTDGYVLAGPLAGTIDATAAVTTISGGWTSFAAQDAHDDGDVDLWIATSSEAAGGSARGAVRLLPGPLAAGTLDPTTSATTTIEGDADEDRFGADVESAGDVDGDGVADLVASGTLASQYGEVALFYGPVASGTLSAWSDADATITTTSKSGLGTTLGDGGDFDGDGRADVIVTGWTLRAYALPTGAVSDGDAFATVTNGGCGKALETRADLDHDGYDDLVTGCGTGSRYAEVPVFYGPFSGTGDTVDATLYYGGYYCEFGAAFATTDYDGDGIDDLVVSSPDSGVGDNVFLVLGGVF